MAQNDDTLSITCVIVCKGTLTAMNCKNDKEKFNIFYFLQIITKSFLQNLFVMFLIKETQLINSIPEEHSFP